jgi:hypothetical protein
MVGILSTNGWYSKYHSLVFRVPTVGISSTKHWYFEFQTLVFLIVGIEIVLGQVADDG